MGSEAHRAARKLRYSRRVCASPRPFAVSAWARAPWASSPPHRHTPSPAIPGTPMPRTIPAPALPSVQPHFSVVLDAAHGGSDSGARLEPQLQEKDVVLALSVRLRSMLTARGNSCPHYPRIRRQRDSAATGASSQPRGCRCLHQPARHGNRERRASFYFFAGADTAHSISSLANGAVRIHYAEPSLVLGN